MKNSLLYPVYGESFVRKLYEEHATEIVAGSRQHIGQLDEIKDQVKDLSNRELVDFLLDF